MLVAWTCSVPCRVPLQLGGSRAAGKPRGMKLGRRGSLWLGIGIKRLLIDRQPEEGAIEQLLGVKLAFDSLVALIG